MRLFIAKHSLLFVAVLSFFVALLLQSVWWWHFNIIDSAMWANQGRYLLDGDPKVFDVLAAYGHPGGTIIEGVLLLAKLTNSDDLALRIFLSLFSAVVVSAAAVCVFVLRRNVLWVVSTVIVLSLHKLYFDATPTTAVAAPLVALLVLFTLVLYEKKTSLNAYSLATWGAISGLLVATRADVGGLATAVFFILLSTVLRVRELALITLVALAVFVIADPFMWFMPVQHIIDLVYKVTYHYSSGQINSPPTPIRILVDILMLAVIAVLLLAVLVYKKVSIVSKSFIVALGVFSLTLLFILLSSKFQAARYFMPLVVLWEVFLPLLLFSLIDLAPSLSGDDKQRLRALLKIIVVIVLFLAHFVTLCLWINPVEPLFPYLFS